MRRTCYTLQHLISKDEGGWPSAEAIAAKHNDLLHVHCRHACGRLARSTRLGRQGRLAPSKGAWHYGIMALYHYHYANIDTGMMYDTHNRSTHPYGS